MTRWMIGVVVLFLVVFSLTAVLTGEPGYILPVLVLALLVSGYAVFNRALMQRKLRRDGSLEDAMSDNTDPIPSTHIVPDDATALGDTPEAHDEINPHDLPVDHPGREAAEEQAARNEARGGTPETRGNRGDEDDLGLADDETTPEGRPQADSAPQQRAGSSRGARSGG